MSEKLQELQKQLKELQEQIKQEQKSNKRKREVVMYSNDIEHDTINTFKILYNKCIEKNQIENLNNILNNLINKLK